MPESTNVSPEQKIAILEERKRYLKDRIILTEEAFGFELDRLIE